jgi:hypothetical protein
VAAAPVAAPAAAITANVTFDMLAVSCENVDRGEHLRQERRFKASQVLLSQSAGRAAREKCFRRVESVRLLVRWAATVSRSSGSVALKRGIKVLAFCA